MLSWQPQYCRSTNNFRVSISKNLLLAQIELLVIKESREEKLDKKNDKACSESSRRDGRGLIFRKGS